MSISTISYLQSASLRQRLIDALDDAAPETGLNTHEVQWLRKITQAAINDDPDPVRVDRLTCNEGSPQPFELAASLMFSHSLTQDRRVFLYTLADGIEAFDDRPSLLKALRTRFAQGDSEAIFEAEKIEDDPFHAQMLNVVEHQVANVTQMSETLKTMPWLSDVVTDALTRQLQSVFPQTPIDPRNQWVEIMPTTDEPAATDVVIQTLAQSAFKGFCKLDSLRAFEQRFLTAQGQVVSEREAVLFKAALDQAQADVPERYTAMLDVFWDRIGGRQRTARQWAVENYQDSLRCQLYNAHSQGTLPTLALRAGLSWLADASSGPSRCQRLSVQAGEQAMCSVAGAFVARVPAEAGHTILWFSPDHRLFGFADESALTDWLASPQGREQLRPALALSDQALLETGSLSFSFNDISGSVCADRVDSIIELQSRNLAYALPMTVAPESVSAMIDDALDVRLLLDPRQLPFHAGRWNKHVLPGFVEAGGAPRPVSAPRDEVPAPLEGAAPVVELPSASAGEVQETAMTGLPSTLNEVRSDDDADADTHRRLNISWVEYAQAFDQRAQRLVELDCVLTEHCNVLLQRYLCVLVEGPIDVKAVHVHWLESVESHSSDTEAQAIVVSETQQATSMDLAAYLLECVSGQRTAPLPEGAQVRIELPGVSGHLTVALINHVLSRVIAGFFDGYTQRFEASRTRLQRLGNQQFLPGQQALAIREDSLRLDLVLGKRLGRIDDAALTLAINALNRPVRSLRAGETPFATEVFSVSLSIGDTPGARLCDALVFMQPLNPVSPVLFWYGGHGWRQFASVEAVRNRVLRGVRGVEQNDWLSRVPEVDRERLSAFRDGESANELRVVLSRVDGHFTEDMQRAVLEHQRQALQQLGKRATRCHFEAGLFTRFANAAEPDSMLMDMLDKLSVRIDNRVFEEMMPTWIQTASLTDLTLYYLIFKHFYQATDDGRDYLFGLPPLTEYTRAQLTVRLQHDFPDQSFNPDEIRVTSHRYVSGVPPTGAVPSAIPAATLERSESLTCFAINRFVDAQDAALSVSSSAEPHVERWITPDYLRHLVRSLDVGQGYTALLRKAFTPNDPDYAERRRLFVTQLPLALLAQALPDKIKGNLSERAFDLLSQVLDMPDGLAREAVNGVKTIISPLQFRADEGMAADPVLGVYVICPQQSEPGPVVLYAVYHEPFVFREYASMTALMNDVRQDLDLQDMLLQRMAPEVRRRYDHGGFAEPHLPFSVEGINDIPLRKPGPVTVALDEIQGNALQALFTGVQALLLDMSVSNSVTNQYANQVGRSFLVTLAISQALALLPNKLASLVTLWQSHVLLRASITSVSSHHWGKALSEFTAALGVMITARQQAADEKALESVDTLVVDEQPDDKPVVLAEDQEQTPFATGWGGLSLTVEQRTRLQALEAQNVALNEMHHDELLNLYTSKESGTPYVVVTGKVYQVRRDPVEGGWNIVGPDGTSGPQLRLDTRQHWQLDLAVRLRGGGAAVTRMASTLSMASAEEGLVIEAVGMTEIRALYRDRARRIGEAHLQAKRYLENCLDNLSLRRRAVGQDPRVTRLIGEFFGTEIPDAALQNEIESAIRTLLGEVMDASLSPISSPRFVVGYNRPGHHRVTAFVIPADPLRRVFLTEQFFRGPVYRLKPEAAAQGFETSTHFQAATLIHELSHLVLDTKDIAYLDSGAPYPDLMRGDTAATLRARSQVERMQTYRFSHRTLRSELFKKLEDGLWVDITREDAAGFATVLRKTGAKTLDEARDIFLSDVTRRSHIMLGNADSVTLLVLLLGRHNFVPVTP